MVFPGEERAREGGENPTPGTSQFQLPRLKAGEESWGKQLQRHSKILQGVVAEEVVGGVAAEKNFPWYTAGKQIPHTQESVLLSCEAKDAFWSLTILRFQTLLKGMKWSGPQKYKDSDEVSQITDAQRPYEEW